MPQRTFGDGYLAGWRWVRGDHQVRPCRPTPNPKAPYPKAKRHTGQA